MSVLPAIHREPKTPVSKSVLRKTDTGTLPIQRGSPSPLGLGSVRLERDGAGEGGPTWTVPISRDASLPLTTGQVDPRGCHVEGERDESSGATNSVWRWKATTTTRS